VFSILPMYRAIFELLITVIVIVVARAVLTSFLKGLGTATSNTFQQPNPGAPAGTTRNGSVPPAPSTGSNLHKDPVCGTYVVEATPFRRQVGSQNFYYCSDACRVKHLERVRP
jgi:YHS domain-containing protein